MTLARSEEKRTQLQAEQLEDRTVPAFVEPYTPEPLLAVTRSLFAVGADAGGNGHVKVYETDGSLRFSFIAFPGFSGSVRVATGDINGDLIDDIVVGAGPGSVGGHVKVFDGASGNQLASFVTFDGFTGGVNVAIGDLNADGYNEVIVGTATGAAHVKLFQLAAPLGIDPNPDDDVAPIESIFFFSQPRLVGSFFAFDGFTGGVTLAAVNYGGLPGDDIVVGTASGASHVKVVEDDLHLLASFIANPGSTAGVNVAVGVLEYSTTREDILVAPATGNGQVKIFGGGTSAFLRSFNPGFTGSVNGLRIALSDTNRSGLNEILVAPGSGQNAVVKGFDAITLSSLIPSSDTYGEFTITAFDGFRGGVFVG